MIGCSLLLFVAMCGNTEIINTSNHKWNDFDQQTLERAKIRCRQLYPKSPCVKTFLKWDIRDYKVICGKANCEKGK